MAKLGSSFDVIMVCCYGDPIEEKGRTIHKGRTWNELEFDMMDEYKEIKNEKEPDIRIWINNSEASIIDLNNEINQIRVWDYDDLEQMQDHIKHLNKLGWS
jgi:hypothetical protein